MNLLAGARTKIINVANVKRDPDARWRAAADRSQTRLQQLIRQEEKVQTAELEVQRAQKGLDENKEYYEELQKLSAEAEAELKEATEAWEQWQQEEGETTEEHDEEEQQAEQGRQASRDVDMEPEESPEQRVNREFVQAMASGALGEEGKMAYGGWLVLRDQQKKEAQARAAATAAATVTGWSSFPDGRAKGLLTPQEANNLGPAGSWLGKGPGNAGKAQTQAGVPWRGNQRPNRSGRGREPEEAPPRGTRSRSREPQEQEEAVETGPKTVKLAEVDVDTEEETVNKSGQVDSVNLL